MIQSAAQAVKRKYMKGEPNTIAIKAMCIFVRNGRMLADICSDGVARSKFYRLVGGGVEFSETAEVAVRREIMEELGTEIINLKFLTVLERVFEYHEETRHQIVFLFQGDLADAAMYDQERIKILDNASEAVWISLDDLRTGKEICYPEFDYPSLA